MIQQPELGRKIADLRKVKGLTQEELVEKCNLNVRTLQRIESGEVTPRASTIKLIFEALDESFDKSLIKDKGLIIKWLGQFFTNVIDLFNLKTNTMRKLIILLTPILITITTLLFIEINANAQQIKKGEEVILKANSDFVKWNMSGHIDSIGSMYYQNASLIFDNIFPVFDDNLPEIIGRKAILSFYQLYNSPDTYFIKRKSKKMIFSKSMIVDIGILQFKSDSVTRSGTYFCQWKYEDKSWCIENEMLNFD